MSTFSFSKDKILLNTSNGKKEFSKQSQIGCTLEILIKKKNQELLTGQITQEAARLYKIRTGKEYKELTGRHVRSLREKGFIVTPRKGVFKFTGEYSISKFNPFSKKIRDQIIKRDNFTCQQCGATEKGGANLTADHIRSQDRGGEATLENGMCLCTTCENRKSKLGIYEHGKKVFQKALEVAKREDMKEDINFLEEVLQVFEKHKMN